ncbi:hypothetical protein C4D60_Mb05t01930 [Musa balbisiana]|uniref:Uncharacterized protein n=1 Tax=Musa balbisiana TaxID=52838 RepID=A0A4V4H7V7_MUSBA|nr:hypothetical protein C4D60_Mb05t01930 [Musa balbisiana]
MEGKDESTYEWGRRASPAHALPHAFPRIPLLPRPALHSPSTSPACACVSVSSPLVDTPPPPPLLSLSLFKLLGGGD